jgi:uncharacterized RDD family membrane protein YckC
MDPTDTACKMCGAPVSGPVPTQAEPQAPPQPVPQPQMPSLEPGRYGGFWARFIAVLIDSIILLPIVFISSLIIPIVGSVIAIGAYEIYFIGSTGQTPGKKFMKLRVLSDNWRKVDYGTAAIRWLSKGASTLICGLGYLLIAADSKKQGLHDKIAGTIVCSESGGAPWQGGGYPATTQRIVY